MTNVKFFDKNGVELKVGDSILIEGNNTPRKIKNFEFKEYPSGFQTVKVSFVGYDTWANLSALTKIVPKLTKVKRTFDEVCELVKQECLFRFNENGVAVYNPAILSLEKENTLWVDGQAISKFTFKRKDSDIWEELEYKDVEE